MTVTLSSNLLKARSPFGFSKTHLPLVLWLIACGVPGAGLAQALTGEVDLWPSAITPEQPFMVQLDAVFPDACLLGDGVLDVAAADDDGFVITFQEQPDDGACAQVETRGQPAFGPFRLPDGPTAGDTVTVIFNVDDGTETTEFGRAELTVVETASAPDVGAQSGVYWDRRLSGNGFALETQGDVLFATILSYDENGISTWHAGAGALNGAVFDGTLRVFSGGACVICRDDFSAPQAADSTPVQIVFQGTARAMLSIGDSPGPALALERFSPREVESEGTITGKTFKVPDFSGRWLFADIENGSIVAVTELESAFSGVSDSGLAFFASADESTTLSCSSSEEGTFRCELSRDGSVVTTFESRDMSHDRMTSPEVLGVRIR